MKTILKFTLILAGVLMITSCEEDVLVNKVDQVVEKSASFSATNYFVVNEPNSLGAIYLTNAAQWKVGDKIRVTGSIKFKRPNDSFYVTSEYSSNCDVKYVTGNAIYVGYDYAGIASSEPMTPMHVELNEGFVELLKSLSGNGGR